MEKRDLIQLFAQVGTGVFGAVSWVGAGTPNVFFHTMKHTT
jgi:hypothetical protein